MENTIIKEKESDKEIQEQQMYRSTFHSMPVGFAVHRAVNHTGDIMEFIFKEVNKSFEKIWGPT